MSNVTFGPIGNAYVPDISKLTGDHAGVSGGVGMPGGFEAPDSLGMPAGGDSFSSVLSNAVHTVDRLHDNAAAQVGNLLQGGGGDLNNVMVAVEKADVAFQLMMQVRNKIVNAYQEIERMQF
jgi:flagellar hook-basal body complex protein FliE